MSSFVVVLGASVEDGLSLVGPFQSEEEAIAYAEGTGEPYRIVPVREPSAESGE